MPADNISAPSARSNWFSPGALLLLSVLGYTLMALWFPLEPNVAVSPPGDVRSFAPGLWGGLAYGALIVVMFGLFLVAVRAAAERGVGLRPLPTLLGGTLLMAAPLLITYPVNAVDVFSYVIHGRIASTYGENPFSVPVNTFENDPFLPLAGEWAGETIPYGPLWEIVAAGVTSISGDNLLVGVLLFKLLMLLCFVSTAVLIWQLLPEGPSRVSSTMLWAWNPGLLLTFIMDGHNDALMLLWLVLGFWLSRRGWPVAGFLIMIIAVMTKPVALLTLPFFFVEIWRSLASRQDRARYMAATLAGGPIVVWLSFLPWAGSEAVLRTALDLALRLSREAAGGAGFSPATWVYMAFGGQVAIETIGLAAQTLFIMFGLWLIWQAFHGRSSLRSAADIFLGYLASALNYRIWYAAWPFPWLLLDAEMEEKASVEATQRAGYRLRAGLWFLLTSQLSVVIYGHIRQIMFDGDQIIAHLIGVPFVFVLPWIMAVIPVRLSRPVHTG